MGKVRINVHRPIPEGFQVKQIRVIRKADKWYVSVCIQLDVEVPDPPPHGHALGVDIGLEKFLATSDGVLVKPPKFFKKMQSQLGLLQRRLSRKQKRSDPAPSHGARERATMRSKNYEKQRIKVARMHHKISNTRKDFHYKQAHALFDQGDMIFLEDLDYRITAKGMLGKEMLDGGFGQFRTITQQVCWKRGKYFSVVDARGSSQTCEGLSSGVSPDVYTPRPNCGVHVQKDLSVRVHKCPECNYEADRDVAAAQVLKNRGHEKISTAGLVGTETA